MASTILQLGALQAIVLAIFLFNKKVNRKANRVLSILVLVLGLLCFLQSVKSIDSYLSFPHLIRLDWGGGLLIAPLIYIYVRLMTGKARQIQAKDLWIFFPYVVNLIVLLPFFIQSGEAKIQIIDHFTATISAGTDQYALYHRLLIAFTALIGLSFSWESMKELDHYRKNIKAEFSAISKKEMLWLRWLILAFLVLFLTLSIVFYLYSRDRYASFDYQIYFYLFAFVLIYMITYGALNQSQIEYPQAVVEPAKDIQSNLSQKQDFSVLISQLENLMISTKPFLNGELTATQLATELQISRHKLSELLSEGFETSFYDLINKFRIEEFKSRVESHNYDHLTLLAIAYDSGFNSKTAFNTAFKKLTGQTPSQYKKSLSKK